VGLCNLGISNAGPRLILIALLILFDLILMLILLLAHNGLLYLKLSYGSMGLELHQFAVLAA